jgi:anti-sigma factor RsiW
MQACRNQNEILMLDVLGELNDPRMRRDWENHLKACDGCRRERAAMRALFGRVKQAGRPPELSAEHADVMAKTIGWKLRNERLKPLPDSPPRRFRFMPALAAACAIMVAVAAGYYFQERAPDREMAMSAEFVPMEDLEVIKHLDLLREMETIEKLMHVVDVPDQGPATEPSAPEETQGMRRNEEEGKYA